MYKTVTYTIHFLSKLNCILCKGPTREGQQTIPAVALPQHNTCTDRCVPHTEQQMFAANIMLSEMEVNSSLIDLELQSLYLAFSGYLGILHDP